MSFNIDVKLKQKVLTMAYMEDHPNFATKVSISTSNLVMAEHLMSKRIYPGFSELLAAVDNRKREYLEFLLRGGGMRNLKHCYQIAKRISSHMELVANGYAGQGNLDALKFLYSLNSKVTASRHGILIAARRGHNNVVEWAARCPQPYCISLNGLSRSLISEGLF